MEIITSDKNPVDLNAKGVALILQNGRNILRTRMGELGLLRDFGVDNKLIDDPIHKIQAKYSKNIKEQLEKYEPRLKLVEINFYNDLDSIRAVVGVEIIDG